MSRLSKHHQKIIVKVGSAVLTDEHGRVRKKVLSNIAQDFFSNPAMFIGKDS